MKLDDEIDKLYQLPLSEFTPARNALAKEAGGADAAAIKALQKPSAPAWAVNQLYWKNRDVYDALIKAAESLRSAHRGLLGGKATDIDKAEAGHRDRVRAAMQEIRRILAEAGDPASEQTITAASETLEALPARDEAAGRLTRPLKRMGFEALAGVAPRAPGAARPQLTLVKSQKPPAESEIAPAKTREIEEIEKRLGTAAAEQRQAKADLERARRELERAERDRARAEEELKEATAKVRRFESDVATHDKALRALAAEQEKLEKRLEKLR